jgi:hypothetical protein
MVTHTGKHPLRAPIPPGWPGDDPTLSDDLAAIGHRRARPERPERPRRPAAPRPVPDEAEGAAPDLGGPVPGDDRPDEVARDARPDPARDADGDDGHDVLDADHTDGDVDEDGHDDLVAGVQPAGRVLVIMVLGLVLAMLVNADALVERAERQPPGPGRDRSLTVWHAVQDVSHVFQLHRVRQLADRVVGDDGERDAVATSGVRADRTSAADGADGGRAAATDDGPAAGARPAPGGAGDDAVDVRTPTADEPLRLWVGGDSQAQVFGQSLVDHASATGLVDPTLHYEMASGLTRPDYYDWPRALAAAVDDVDPEVVVVVFGVNDAQGIVLSDGTPVPEVTDPRWSAEYGRRVGDLMDQLRADDRVVLWVAQPPMREPGYDSRIAIVDQAVAAEAAERPWIVLVDPAPVVGDAAGAYADALPDATGAPVDVRQSDGIHLTPAGGERLATHVLDLVAAHVDLSGSGGMRATAAGDG